MLGQTSPDICDEHLWASSIPMNLRNSIGSCLACLPFVCSFNNCVLSGVIPRLWATKPQKEVFEGTDGYWISFRKPTD